ncbi:MAG TPA: adenosylcobinamide-GDP ribazoletransferase, partial [Nitrosopumilaceae archaeon]|nr:adenosylcobinamide-GDP ribazoletransferase [Nitrosopumilaceae archaeon]
MLREIGSLFSFLTIIPTTNSNLETVAKYMYIFPIIGLIIGGLVGGIGYGLAILDVDPLIVSLLVVTV